MNKLILIGLLVFNIASCQNKENTNTIIKKSNIMNDQPIYTLKISVANPYETYVNDMPVEKDYEKGSTNTEIPVNDFILKSGVQFVKIVLLPEKGKSEVDKSGIDYVNVKIYQYPHGLSNMSSEDKVLIKEFNLSEFRESPVISKEIQFEARVHYEVKGWSESADLSKENLNVLKDEVLDKYSEIKQTLNEGDTLGLSKKYQKRNEEIYTSLYNDITSITEDKKWMHERILKSKGKMIPFENLKVVFYAKGKIVSLENLNHESPLIANIDDKEEVYNILLHRPKSGSSLEVIR
ncbi:hypothetical protein [Flavobacterium sp. EDS]|uniref:hypothetical protein n=1 Tax=Flavobacterium sp. EDS TaxID=2897328 RepID=UPI001E5535B6|nr:hypothetical protein [Flavobacterium sp. EDS]